MPDFPGFDHPKPPLTSHAVAAAEIARLRTRCRELHAALARLAEACVGPAHRLRAAELTEALRAAQMLVAREAC